MLGLAARARLAVERACRFGLADALSRIRLYSLGRAKPSWLAFRHGKDEYGVDCAGEEVPRQFKFPKRGPRIFSAGPC